MRIFASLILMVWFLFGATVAAAQKPEGPSFQMAFRADGSLGGDLDEPAGIPNTLLKIDGRMAVAGSSQGRRDSVTTRRPFATARTR